MKLLVAFALLLAAPEAFGQERPHGLAFTHVTVVDVTGGPSRPDMTVIVRGNLIEEVGPSADVSLPVDVTVVDGTGRFLIPGLWDMHVHSAANAEREFPLYLALGVTGVRNMHSTADSALAVTTAIKQRVRAGTLLGPRFVANGPVLDGPIRAQRGSVGAATAEEARRAVDSLADGGADFIKVYNFIPPEAYFAAMERAAQRGLPVVGHIPIGVGAVAAADAGQRSVEHLDGLDFACSTRADSILGAFLAAPSRESWKRAGAALVATWSAEACGPAVEAYRRNGTWQVPTLSVVWALVAADSVLADSAQMAVVPAATEAWWRSVVGEMAEGEMRTERDRFAQAVETTRLLHRAGVPILAGTDVGNPFLVPGYSLHRELELLVEAGLTPLEALQTATLNPARYFGTTDSTGTIAPGQLADLVLLDADPLADITNTQRIRAVVANGRLLTRTDLDRLLAEAEASAQR